ncbi:MAG: hypothetical protein R2824_06270 [Saprospiraceae bacterium]|nr:hypothetical protein [Lewinella sp.]
MKTTIFLLLICHFAALTANDHAPVEKPIVLTAVKLDATMTKEMQKVSFDFLKMDRKGYWRVSKGYVILEYKASGRLIFQREGDDVIAMDGKEEFDTGITVHCYGCAVGGCEPKRDKTARGYTYTCTSCNKNDNVYTGCMASVEVPSKKIVDRETADGRF